MSDTPEQTSLTPAETWSRVCVGMEPIAEVLYLLRGLLRVEAFRSEQDQFYREDSLDRVAKLDEAERKLSDALLTVKTQLVHCYGESSTHEIQPSNPDQPLRTALTSAFIN